MWLYARLKSSHGAAACDELLSELDFELGDLIVFRRHPGKHVARQETHGELVRVLNDDRVVGCQANR